MTFRLSSRLCGDKELARRVAGGDSAAFDEMFRRYSQPIYRFCSAMVGVEEAKDVLQNVMTKAVTSMPDDKDFQLKPWLYRVARNECVDQIRKGQRANCGLEPDEFPDASRDPHRAVENRERLNQLVEDLNELPEKQRAALVMRELSGLKYAEIAGGVGTSEAGAKQIVYEARLALEQMDLGRGLDCAEVRQTISEKDRRRLRGRRLRSHLRVCTGCREFEQTIRARETEFQSLYPVLPVGLAAGVLGAIREGGYVAGETVGVATGGAAAGGLVSAGIATKGFVAIVVAGGIGVGSAEVVKHRDSTESGSDPVSRVSERSLDLAPAALGSSPKVAAPGRLRIQDGSRRAEPPANRRSRREGGSSMNPGSPVSRQASPGSQEAVRLTPGLGNGSGPSNLPAASATGQARAGEASGARPGQSGGAPPSRKPLAPPGQTTKTGGADGSAAAGTQVAGGEKAPGKAVGKPEKPAKPGE